MSASVTPPPRPEVGVGAVCVEDGRLLIIRRAREPHVGRWSIPGGRVEPGESVTDATLRELVEETGCRGAVGELVGWAEIREPGFHYVVLDFDVTDVDRSGEALGEEVGELAWVAADELDRYDLVPGLAAFLHDRGVLARIGGS